MNHEMSQILRDLTFVPEGAITASEVEAIQRDLGRRLPRAYLEFLAEFGGGQFDELISCRCDVAPPDSTDGRVLISTFLAGNGDGGIKVVTDRARSVGVPDDLQPIADTLTGSYFCLGTRPSREGVFYWEHETGEVYRVSDSFEEMIQGLRIEEDPPEDDEELSRIRMRIDPDFLSEM